MSRAARGIWLQELEHLLVGADQGRPAAWLCPHTQGASSITPATSGAKTHKPVRADRGEDRHVVRSGCGAGQRLGMAHEWHASPKGSRERERPRSLTRASIKERVTRIELAL
ncbi:hypothetical protein GCM10027028_40390 [Streptomyces sundarbansensis]